MMNFTKLTNSDDGKTIFINLSLIVTICAEDGETELWESDNEDKCWTVRETPEEIFAMIAASHEKEKINDRQAPHED